jgi:hypothetical protein
MVSETTYMFAIAVGLMQSIVLVTIGFGLGISFEKSRAWVREVLSKARQ